jgi:two-component system sensor histidine kinase YesM
MKIRTKLLLLLILTSAVPLFINMFISYYTIQDKLESSFIDTNKTQVDQTAQALQLAFEDLDRKLLSIYQTPDFYNYLMEKSDDKYEWLEQQKKATNLLFVLAQSLNRKCDILLYNTNLETLYKVNGKSLNVDIQNPLSDIDRLWINSAVSNSGNFTITKVITDKTSSNSMIAVTSRSVSDVLTNKNIGVLAVEINAEFIKAAIGEDLSKVNLSILDADGKTVYQTVENIGNTDNYLVVTSTKNSYGWRVTKYIPKSLLHEIAWETVNPILSYGIIFLIVGIVLSLIFSWQISKPILQLTRKMDKASKGDFTVSDISASKTSQNELFVMAVQFNQMLTQIDELIKNEYKLKLEEYSARMAALQAQINPHFLYNTLMTIYSEALDVGSESICTMVKRLSSIFRYAVEGDRSIVTLSDEIEHVKNYLEIQKYRYEENFNYSIDIPENLLSLPALKLSIQPIVENAVIHGIAPRGEGKVKINAENDKEQITVVVEDNGEGISSEDIKFILDKLDHQTRVSDHIGINNVHQRILNTFAGSGGISIESEQGKGTKMTISWKVAEND